jgi:hypothetical protein
MSATATTPQTVTFRSRFSEHVLTRVPRLEGHTPMGQRTVVQAGERFQFKGHLLAVRPGRNVHQDSMDWLADDADPIAERDEVEALKAHREFGKDFWEEGHAPGTLYPRPQEFRKSVVTASVALDADEIQRLLDQEFGTHNRAELVQFAKDTLETIQETQAAMAEGDDKAKK